VIEKFFDPEVAMSAYVDYAGSACARDIQIQASRTLHRVVERYPFGLVNAKTAALIDLRARGSGVVVQDNRTNGSPIGDEFYATEQRVAVVKNTVSGFFAK
jgi:hypothetical protein